MLKNVFLKETSKKVCIHTNYLIENELLWNYLQITNSKLWRRSFENKLRYLAFVSVFFFYYIMILWYQW